MAVSLRVINRRADQPSRAGASRLGDLLARSTGLLCCPPFDGLPAESLRMSDSPSSAGDKAAPDNCATPLALVTVSGAPRVGQVILKRWVGSHSLPMDPTKSVLESATFGFDNQTIDVTVIIRFLLIVQGNRKLTLRPPHKGPRFWYIWLFGDPCPRKTKFLLIKSRDGSGKIHTRILI